MKRFEPLRIELLTIADRFQISDTGVIIFPDFSVPNDGWAARTEQVRIVTHEGQDFETPATFQLSHFRILDVKVSIDRRWRVTITLPNRLSAEVPVGSKLFVSQEIGDALLAKTAPNQALHLIHASRDFGRRTSITKHL